MMQNLRPTFEQATKNILTESSLRCYIMGDRVPTGINWMTALQEDRLTTHALIDNLCEDLAAITGDKIKRFSNLRIECFGASQQISQDFQVELTWKSFLKRFPAFINQVINSLTPDGETNSPFIYRLNRVWWDKGDACTNLPTCMEEIKFIKLINPDCIPCENEEKPSHIQKKLEILQETHYDYQPYIIRGRKNSGKLLVLRLGCQWPDIAIATWEPPAKFKNMNNFLMGSSVFMICLSLICLNIYSYFENTILQVAAVVLAAALGITGCLFASLSISRKYRPLKV